MSSQTQVRETPSRMAAASRAIWMAWHVTATTLRNVIEARGINLSEFQNECLRFKSVSAGVWYRVAGIRDWGLVSSSRHQGRARNLLRREYLNIPSRFWTP